MSLLLTSVFGPFGVDDKYGRKENKMELFHNQVTREQGIFSYRFNHNSQGLFLLADNIDYPTTVLDFPTLKQFRKELKKKYDYIGISLIMPNFKKAQKMAQLIREESPQSKIILGGHGVNAPNIESLIEYDYICRGEGVKFLRKLFNENIDRPIKHPVMFSSFNRQVMGVPLPQESGILIPGVGCPNKCRFCSTSHFFGEYTPYLETGKQIYDLCCEYEDKLKVRDFGVLDENFLKFPQRAMELLELMEKNKRYFTFAIFSSAETLKKLGDLDILVRLGVKFIWIGVESKKEAYEKNAGTDFYFLFRELKKRGISVLASAILFLEDHDKNTIWEDVDFAISLNPDYLQFMQLGPVPVTTLYTDYIEKNKMMFDIPYEEWHGQDQIWFEHPHFTRKDSRKYIKAAFQKDYRVNGASFLRAVKTSLMGYQYTKSHSDPRVRGRSQEFSNQIKLTRYFLLSATVFSKNHGTKRLLNEIKREYKKDFAITSWKTKIMSMLVLGFGIKERLKMIFTKNARSPKMLIRRSEVIKSDNKVNLSLYNPSKTKQVLASS